MKPKHIELLILCSASFILGICISYIFSGENKVEYIKTKECDKAYVQCYCPPCHTLGASMTPKCKPSCIKGEK